MNIGEQQIRPANLERAQELFDFLQGTLPEGYKIPRRKVPKLTPDQAWTVVWYLGNLYWQVPDDIERCDVCGTLYDSGEEGYCRDEEKPPYHFCGPCWDREPDVSDGS